MLARICGTIAVDEKRHENAYIKIVKKLLEIEPNGAIIAIGDMMRKKITMPAHLMHDGRDPHLFDHFSAVAQRLGAYTTDDLMHDGRDPHLFDHFSAVAQRLGAYTTVIAQRGAYTTDDYADIVEFLIGRWELEKLDGLKGDGRNAQEFVCGLPQRIRRLQERADERAKRMKPLELSFSWIFNRKVLV